MIDVEYTVSLFINGNKVTISEFKYEEIDINTINLKFYIGDKPKSTAILTIINNTFIKEEEK